MPGQARFELTPQGHAKLYRAYRSTLEHSKKLLGEGSEKIVKVNASQRAPSNFEEAKILSVGTITKPFVDSFGRSRGEGTRGSWDPRRFMKIGNQKFLREAILGELVKVKREMDQIYVRLGDPRLYNPGLSTTQSIGFSWRGAGLIRSTDDAEAGGIWRYLLESWEYGGSYSVVPRTGRALEPERGVLAAEMSKTIPQFGMFSKAGRDSKPLLRIFIMRELKKEIRAEFGR